ncbi:hypothetical protein Ocin01_12176 [Orchesella cincta]|uniref:Uncharacterized protein n=1 Tax=Orchesella cincta TaxID=48709 RepID=A0A1D2MN48_ORCCI|nr:hypothetical protein Ocin01_12176 [Orchesella cincta]
MSGIQDLLTLDSGSHCNSEGSGLGCGISRIAGSLSGSSLASSLLLLSSSHFQPVESFISFVSLQSSYAWYMHLSDFETVFLSLVMLQVFILRYLEILPINVNNLFLGESSGRRKKRSFWKTNQFNCESDLLTQSLFKVLKKLDHGNCVALTICELESMSTYHESHFSPNNQHSLELPTETKALLKALKLSAKYRSKSFSRPISFHTNEDDTEDGNEVVNKPENSDPSTSSYCAAIDGLKKYEEAVLIGSSAAATHAYANSTLCEDKYSACPLTKEDIEHYVGILVDANVL